MQILSDLLQRPVVFKYYEKNKVRLGMLCRHKLEI